MDFRFKICDAEDFELDSQRNLMVKAIVAQNALEASTNLVLYRSDLPQNTFSRHPSLRVVLEVKDHAPLWEKSDGDLCYDDQGFPTSLMRLGLLIDSYF